MREDNALTRLAAHGVNEIPDGWRVSKVKYLADYINGYPFNPEDWGDIGRPIIRIQNLTDSNIEANRYDAEIAEVYSIKAGDFLISWSASLGLHVWNGEPAWLNQHIFRVDLYEDKCTLNFFRWLATWFMEELARDSHGSTMQHLTKDAFGSFPVLIPEKTTQIEIAEFLDSKTAKLDELISAKQNLLKLLAEKRRALITQAVTKGLDSAVMMKDSCIPWLGEIPAHWEIWKIGHFSSVGNGTTPLRDNPLYWHNGSIPWLNSASTNEAEISSSTQFVTEQAVRECHLPLVKKNSVLIAITGQGKTRGQAAVLLFDATINQHVAYVTADKERIIPHFLYLWFVAQYNYIRAMSEDGGGTKGVLTCEDISALRIGLPPLTEQKLIYQFVQHETTKLDLLSKATERTIKLLQERRAALISAAVTGKIPMELMNLNTEASYAN